MEITIEFFDLIGRSSTPVKRMIERVAYHSSLLKGKIVEPVKSTLEPIDRLLTEFQAIVEANNSNGKRRPLLVQRGGNHIFVSCAFRYTNNRDVYDALFVVSFR